MAARLIIRAGSPGQGQNVVYRWYLQTRPSSLYAAADHQRVRKERRPCKAGAAGVRPNVWQKEEGLSCSKYSVIYSICIVIDYFYCTSETNFIGSFHGLGEITLIFQVQKIHKIII